MIQCLTNKPTKPSHHSVKTIAICSSVSDINTRASILRYVDKPILPFQKSETRGYGIMVASISTDPNLIRA